MKTTRKRLPKIEWKQLDNTPSGNEQWQSADGMIKLQHVTRYYDVAYPSIWVLWVWKAGDWQKLDEHRSKARIIKLARVRAEQLESEDDSE